MLFIVFLLLSPSVLTHKGKVVQRPKREDRSTRNSYPQHRSYASVAEAFAESRCSTLRPHRETATTQKKHHDNCNHRERQPGTKVLLPLCREILPHQRLLPPSAILNLQETEQNTGVSAWQKALIKFFFSAT
jgi:hypothetical protein